MRLLKRSIVLVLMLSFILMAAGCQQSSAPQSQQDTAPASVQQEKNIELIVSAAASMKDAMEEIKELYAQEKTNVTITYNFGSSGSLQQQIEQGAPADVFLSAAAKQMDALKEKGLIIEDTYKELLENKVVLIAPKDSSKVSGFEGLDAEDVQKVALGEPESVPAGKYAKEVLTNLKLWDKVQTKATLGKDVRVVLTWVETGDVDAGIVYGTDAKISDKVKVVETAPEGSHSPVIYPAAVIKDSKNEAAAREFITFLTGDKAKDVFEKYGFSVLAK
ncbi:molybdate ABC transporter substrate-binding protein [Petroclostridium sp. X23]|nr:molybdate ABC transporter substrate-binding protein [Petroclostridium sp. X23]WHH61726.1 molybdate ABC transporter substrate-binding protein [Petroclostridium sp. X23]